MTIVYQNSCDTVEVIGYLRGPRVIMTRTLFRHKWPAFHWVLVVEWEHNVTKEMMDETYGNLGKNKKHYKVIHQEFLPYSGSRGNKRSQARMKQLREKYKCYATGANS